MKLKALDTMHISNVQSEPIRPGQEFTLNDADAKRLIERGLAKRVSSSKGGKKAPAPNNKKSPEASNKSQG